MTKIDGERMLHRFVILSGTAVAPKAETARTAAEALDIVRELMRLRRPGVLIETVDGKQLSFFQLKDLVEAESREAPKPGPRGPYKKREENSN
jgi:hypothetical protein